MLEKTISIVDRMLRRQKPNIETDIDAIMLVGGVTYMTQVKNKLSAKYNKPIPAKF